MHVAIGRARKELTGPPEGRLIIAIEDMEKKQRKGDRFGDPKQRLFGFMKVVDPVDARTRTDAMHAEGRIESGTPEAMADQYLATEKGRQALHDNPNFREQLILVYTRQATDGRRYNA